VRTVLILAGALALSACATGRPAESSAEKLDRLNAECRARGGVLVPSAGPMTGRPETDNICRISGGASRL
jgi:hypothetical protein